MFIRLQLNQVVSHCQKAGIKNFSVAVAAYNYRKHQVCIGEVCVRGEMVDFILSHNPNYTTRELLRNPDYNGSLSLFDSKIKYIKGLEDVIDYIFQHNLLNIIVEFTLFSCPVGIHHEKISIWELRKDY